MLWQNLVLRAANIKQLRRLADLKPAVNPRPPPPAPILLMLSVLFCLYRCVSLFLLLHLAHVKKGNRFLQGLGGQELTMLIVILLPQVHALMGQVLSGCKLAQPPVGSIELYPLSKSFAEVNQAGGL